MSPLSFARQQFPPAIIQHAIWLYLRFTPSPRWHLDEMVIRVSGKLMHLWRAVDNEGEVLQVLVQRHLVSRRTLRTFRAQAVADWRAATAAARTSCEFRNSYLPTQLP